VGLAVWVAVFESGVHATIAGVVLGLLAPARPSHPDEVVRGWALELVEEPTPGDMQQLRQVAKHGESLVERLEGALHPWTSFLIVPVFALANTGVRFEGLSLGGEGAAAVAVGTAVALVFGKLGGILLATWLAVRSGVGELPDGLCWREVAGAAACGGIGFTVSLFVAGLAFDDAGLADAAKVGILVASVAAAAIAASVLLRRPASARPRTFET
jgi:Na+:H+ antiporter, NhaA family